MNGYLVGNKNDLNLPQEWDTEHEKQLLHWTTEPPKVEGWYWVNVNVAGYDAQVITHYPYASNENIDKITHWLGPLPVPEPPKEERSL